MPLNLTLKERKIFGKLMLPIGFSTAIYKKKLPFILIVIEPHHRMTSRSVPNSNILNSTCVPQTGCSGQDSSSFSSHPKSKTTRHSWLDSTAGATHFYFSKVSTLALVPTLRPNQDARVTDRLAN
jgi:hypothetical protein